MRNFISNSVDSLHVINFTTSRKSPHQRFRDEKKRTNHYTKPLGFWWLPQPRLNHQISSKFACLQILDPAVHCSPTVSSDCYGEPLGGKRVCLIR
ncbi:hypothetical protein YC2023_005268 [Brassica napus]